MEKQMGSREQMRLGKKAKRTFNRAFWSILPYLPKSIRERIVRSKFKVDYNLPKELTFKVADTAAEIEEAFKLVHDAYVELGYIDRNEHQLKFSKYQVLSNAVILVAKWNEEVVGTISILPDSSMGLPCDSTWDLSTYRKNGAQIAEMSALTIKPSFRKQGGGLLLPLCKLMWYCCREILKVDGVVCGIDYRAEPFYTDLLLGSLVNGGKAKSHNLVNGNKSVCVYGGTEELKARFKEVYGHLPESENIYEFFYQRELDNMLLPKKKKSLQATMVQKNIALSEVLERYPTLAKDVSLRDKQVISNLDSGSVFASSLICQSIPTKRQRLIVNQNALVKIGNGNIGHMVSILDMSDGGFKFRSTSPIQGYNADETLSVSVRIDNQQVSCRAKIVWSSDQHVFGCKLETDGGGLWSQSLNRLREEIDLAVNQRHQKQTLALVG